MNAYRPNTERSLLDEIVQILSGTGNPETRISRALLVSRRRNSGGMEKFAHGRAAGLPATGQSQCDVGEHKVEYLGLTTEKTAGSLLIGDSPAMEYVRDSIQRVSQSQATVMLRGESGTGKELVAKAIHEASSRRNGSFVPVHCAAVPESLIESTLFGHERGAFTGAVQRRRGKLDQAATGTLFLDEVGDIPLGTQVKLLRVIQEREYERVGGMGAVPVDVRIIAATHRDLEAMVSAGAFREDLYYRLNVVPLTLPPLRERKEDILPLIEHFVVRFNRENRRQVRLGRDLLTTMAGYHWPGNIRELQNCVERLVVLAEPGPVTLSSVPQLLKPYFDHMRQVTTSTVRSEKTRKFETLPGHIQTLERERLRQVLEQVGWVKSRAAKALGLTPRQVAYKLKKYGIGCDA